MTKEERQNLIIGKITQENRIYITELCKELNVSDDTIRRDLSELDQLGILRKVHGGAVPKNSFDMDFNSRVNHDIEQKRMLASNVIPLFRNNDVLLIDGGTSNLEVVKQLPPHMNFTIYTNSFPIAMQVMQQSNIDLQFLGGTLYRSSQVTVGITVYKELQSIRANWLLLGVCSIHPQVGLTCPDREEAAIKSLMLDRANKTIIIADDHKIDKAENYVIGTIKDIDYLVTSKEKVTYINLNWPSYSFKLIS